MVKIIHPNERQIIGPWLISSDKIELLDTMINKLWNLMEKINQPFIEKEIMHRIERSKKYNQIDDDMDHNTIEEQVKNSYPFSKKHKTITCFFKNQKKSIGSSVDDFIKDRNIKDHLPIGIEIELEYGYISININFNRNYIFNKLFYKINASEEMEISDIYYEIDKWIQAVRPNPLLQFWQIISPFHWILCGILGLVVLITSLPISKLNLNDIAYRNEVRMEIHKLIDKGITKDDLPKCIDYFLRLNTYYLPKDYTTNTGTINNLFIIFIIVFIISVIISFKPNTNLAIGKGVFRVKFWRIYLKLIFVFIPLSIILPIILNNIKFF